MNRPEHAPGLCLALQIVREVAKNQAGYSDEREAIFEALSEAYVEAQAGVETQAEVSPRLYTCLGKGGCYELLGESDGSGTSRGERLVVYRDTTTGRLFHRTPLNFAGRMELVEAQAPEQMLETGRRPGLATLRADQPTYEQLRQRLLDLAAGARSKADLLASQSPTSRYINPVDVLRALAKEAEEGLAARPGLEIERTLVLSTAHITEQWGNFLNDQLMHRTNQGQRADTPQLLVVDPIGKYGYRVCLTTDGALTMMRDAIGQATSLAQVMRFARDQGCDWLALDRDGETVDGLPIYEEED